jgi:hypothetical protein
LSSEDLPAGRGRAAAESNAAVGLAITSPSPWCSTGTSQALRPTSPCLKFFNGRYTCWRCARRVGFEIAPGGLLNRGSCRGFQVLDGGCRTGRSWGQW